MYHQSWCVTEALFVFICKFLNKTVSNGLCLYFSVLNVKTCKWCTIHCFFYMYITCWRIFLIYLVIEQKVTQSANEPSEWNRTQKEDILIYRYTALVLSVVECWNGFPWRFESCIFHSEKSWGLARLLCPMYWFLKFHFAALFVIYIFNIEKSVKIHK